MFLVQFKCSPNICILFYIMKMDARYLFHSGKGIHSVETEQNAIIYAGFHKKLSGQRKCFFWSIP